MSDGASARRAEAGFGPRTCSTPALGPSSSVGSRGSPTASPADAARRRLTARTSAADRKRVPSAPMASPPRSTSRVGRGRVLPTALGTAPRVVGPAIARAGATDGVPRRRELEIGLTTVVLMALLANGPAVAVIAVVVLVAAGLGSLQVLGAVEGPYAERGVPVESLILPALTALGAVGVVRLIAVGPAILVAVVLTGILLDRELLIEARLIASPQSPSGDDRA